MSSLSYYQNELKRVKPHATEYAPTIKVFANGNGEDTKHLNLNKESAEVLIQWLTDNFVNTDKSIIKKIQVDNQQIIEYSVIAPIKKDNTYLPNIVELEKLKNSNQPVNIFTQTFINFQTEGKTILINKMGGWCFLTPDMKII